MLQWTEIDIPGGPRLRIVGSAGGLRAIDFDLTRPCEGQRNDRNFLLCAVARQLEDYFQGTRREFEVPLDPRGTEFQLRVWRQLLTIPYGTTHSYSQVAIAIGAPSAVRAVGAANGANPIPIIVPCHRVIGSNGKLTGYGGGLPLKRRLLELEGCISMRLAE
jgi:methylated-DNA-[protein]-cysteine S-methyltransferase